MKLIILSFILCLQIVGANAQDDAITVVAVGEAERQVEKFAVGNPQIEAKLKGREAESIQEFIELLRNDFSFYKHRYEVAEKPADTGFTTNYSKWKKDGMEYVVVSKITLKNEQLYLELKAHSVVLEKVFFEYNDKFLANNVRQFGHKIADDIYQKLNNKESIFQKKIIFVSDRTSRGADTRKELYIMDFDGQRIQRLTFNNSMIISPSVSPDNAKIMYSVIESKWKRSSRGKPVKVQNINLYMYDMATRKSTLLSSVDGLNSGAIFSSDPSKIYLTLSHQKNADIYEMNLVSKATRKVTNHYADDVDPSINASGSLMTFLSGRPGKAMIYTLDPRGEEKAVNRIGFVGKFNAAPRFSPDGKEIVFSSWVDDRFDIYKLNSDGSNLVRLTKNFGSNEEASFSPDAEFIIFSSQRVISRKKAEQDLYIMNKDGEIIRKLTNNYGKIFTPRWTN